MKASRTRATVVVDVVDGNLGHAELVEDTLAAGRITVDVAGDAMLDIVIVDVCVKPCCVSKTYGYESTIACLIYHVAFGNWKWRKGHENE